MRPTGHRQVVARVAALQGSAYRYLCMPLRWGHCKMPAIRRAGYPVVISRSLKLAVQYCPGHESKNRRRSRSVRAAPCGPAAPRLVPFSCVASCIFQVPARGFQVAANQILAMCLGLLFGMAQTVFSPLSGTCDFPRSGVLDSACVVS